MHKSFKKALMIGDANHYFNRKLVSKMKLYSEHIEIHFISTHFVSVDINELPYDEIIDISKNIPYIFNIKGLRKLFNLYMISQMKNRLSRYIDNNHYDIIHIQYLTEWIFSAIKEFSGKLILTVWGSDFYRISSRNTLQISRLVQKSDAITFASNRISEDFSKVFNSIEKHRIVRFGLDLLDNIDIERTKVERTNNKINITIGYNRSVYQNHIAIIKEISKLDQLLLKQIKITIPFAYGATYGDYKRQIEEKLKALDVEYIFLEEFMSEEELAKQRLLSDIMIQLQSTDALSGSMQEYMYADNIVITGSWLPYDDLIKEGAYFEETESINRLEDKLRYVLSEYDFLKSKTIVNRNIIKNLSGWDINTQKWMNLYDKKDN